MTELDSVGSPSDFHHITARLKVPLAPVFLTKPASSNHLKRSNPPQDSHRIKVETESADKDPEPANPELTSQEASNGALEAVNQSIASLLMKYIPSLGSVLVSYLQPPVFILQDKYGQPIRRVANKLHHLPIPTIPGVGWGVIDVEVNLMGWRPTIGQKLVGRPTLSSPSHLSLVVYQTFNATIHENHLKSAGCHYDLNVQVPKNWKNLGKENVAPGNSWDWPTDTADENKECGCWVDAEGKVVGGDDGTVSFTVISLTVANHMISVIGSLLDDPFSIESIAPDQPIFENLPSRTERSSSYESSSSDDDDQPRLLYPKRNSRSSNQLSSPPTVKSANPVRRSPRNSENDVTQHPQPKRNNRSSQPVKTPKSRKLKRSAPATDELQRTSTSPTLSNINLSISSPAKRRESSLKPRVSSTPSKKKLKTQ